MHTKQKQDAMYSMCLNNRYNKIMKPPLHVKASSNTVGNHTFYNLKQTRWRLDHGLGWEWQVCSLFKKFFVCRLSITQPYRLRRSDHRSIWPQFLLLIFTGKLHRISFIVIGPRAEKRKGSKVLLWDFPLSKKIFHSRYLGNGSSYSEKMTTEWHPC